MPSGFSRHIRTILARKPGRFQSFDGGPEQARRGGEEDGEAVARRARPFWRGRHSLRAWSHRATGGGVGKTVPEFPPFRPRRSAGPDIFSSARAGEVAGITLSLISLRGGADDLEIGAKQPDRPSKREQGWDSSIRWARSPVASETTDRPRIGGEAQWRNGPLSRYGRLTRPANACLPASRILITGLRIQAGRAREDPEPGDDGITRRRKHQRKGQAGGIGERAENIGGDDRRPPPDRDD